jgi:hypothetical protein
VIAHADVIVVGNKSPEFVEALQRTHSNQIVIDLVRVSVDSARIPAEYRGICW